MSPKCAAWGSFKNKRGLQAWQFYWAVFSEEEGGGQTGERLKGFARPLGFLTTFINHSFLARIKAFIHRKNKYVGKGQLYFTP